MTVAATKQAFERARQIWSLWGAEDHVGLEVFEGDHHFSGRKGFPFLKQHL